MISEEDKKLIASAVRLSRLVTAVGVLVVAGICVLIFYLLTHYKNRKQEQPAPQLIEPLRMALRPVGGRIVNIVTNNNWSPPEENTISRGKAGDQIRYGRELIAHTAKYFGPRGSIAHLANGMNCQNCHLEGGTKVYANNFSGVAATYPKLSARSGKIATAAVRIAECFERSLAGKVPDTAGREVQAMLAYINWLGKGVKKSPKPFGSASEKLPFMARAADPLKGRDVFVAKCRSCHGKNGEGLLTADSASYAYPPLWGKDSYNDGAGMYRIGNLAGFVKNNMPFGVTYKSPQLTNEEAWNVAAFINSRPRPHKDQHRDWPKLNNKPIDYPFGPYADKFAEVQHKYGPFKPIQEVQKLTDK